MDEDGWLLGGGYEAFDYAGKLPQVNCIQQLKHCACSFSHIFPLIVGVSATLTRRTLNCLASETWTLTREPKDFKIIRLLVDCIVEVTGHSWEKWEAPVVTRYDPGAIFARHGGASSTKGREWENL
jgi:hypothetical protein